MSQEPFVSRAKAAPANRSEKGYGNENDAGYLILSWQVFPLPILSSVSHYLHKESVIACLMDLRGKDNSSQCIVLSFL